MSAAKEFAEYARECVRLAIRQNDIGIRQHLLDRGAPSLGVELMPVDVHRIDDAQRPEFAVGFRYEHSSDGSRSISLLPERKRQFAEPSLHPIRLDIRELLTIHARCALVGAALGIRRFGTEGRSNKNSQGLGGP